MGARNGIQRAPGESVVVPFLVPETPRDDQNRRRVASGSEKVDYSSHGSLGKPSRSDFRLIFGLRAQSPNLVSCGPGRTEQGSAPIEASRPAASANFDNRAENRPRIARKASLGPLGRPFRSTSVARSECIEPLRATRCDSGRPGSIEEVCRSNRGRSGLDRGGVGRRAGSGNP